MIVVWTQPNTRPRIPREVAVNKEGQIIAIKWNTAWHNGTCRCEDCGYVHESFEPLP